MKIKIHTAEADLSALTEKVNADYLQPGSKFAAILRNVQRPYFISESKQEWRKMSWRRCFTLKSNSSMSTVED